MAFIAVPNTAKVAVKMTYFGQNLVNVHHFSTLGEINIGSLISLGEKVNDVYGFSLAARLSDQLHFIGTEVTDLTAQDADSTYVPFGSGAGGNITGTALPGNCAAVVTKHTALRGRSYRGRTYLPGIDASVLSGGNFGATWVGQILAAMAELFTLDTTIPWLLSVVSYYLNKSKRTEGVATLIDTMSMDNYVDSQRRRLPGRGD